MRRLRRFLLVAAAAVAVAVVCLWLTLPPATRHFSPAPPTTIYGAYHVHSNRSDGSGSLDDIAAAAAAAGLRFVIVTDHGDATRAPEAPAYRRGVLVIDAVEIGTESGHMVALGLTAPSPYPLGAEARDTVEDVHRMGGWTVAAHPESPKDGLRWRDDSVVADGVEWLNADSEWRDEPASRLLIAAGHYLFRPPEAIASVFDRPASSLRRWDALMQKRAIVGLGGVDAHARIGLDEAAASPPARTILARPGYTDMFRTVVQAIDLPQPLRDDAARDAEVILSELRKGHTYSVVTALGTPVRVSFTASQGGVSRGVGEWLDGDQPVTLAASVPEPQDATVVLYRAGEEVAAGVGGLTFEHAGPAAAYRVEVRLPGHQVPWIVTNAIRVGRSSPEARGPDAPPASLIASLDNQAVWALEKQAASTGDVYVEGREVRLAFGLAPGRSAGQYAAMAYPLSGQERFDLVTLTVRASEAMRVSIQVRAPGGSDGIRWHRSVYADTTPRTVTLRFDEFSASGALGPVTVPAAGMQSLLVVVDTSHTRPGTQGQVWISNVSLGALDASKAVTSLR